IPSTSFGIESRKELKKALDGKLKLLIQLDEPINKLKKNKDEIKRLTNEIQALNIRNSQILGDLEYEDWKKEYYAEKLNIESVINEISIEISKIKKSREEITRLIEEKEENIVRYEKDIVKYNEEINEKNQDKKRLNQNLNELKSNYSNKNLITTEFLMKAKLSNQ
ncbi:MAG: hypothetical protein P8Y97_16245, partial [Candidatus Lokiarchaeota archaeon]